MKDFLKKYTYAENQCPFRIVMDHFGNKWSMIIIIRLGENGKMRFNELDKCIADISQKMLTSTLRMLEEDGFVERTVYPEIPPRVEYALTALGQNLLPLIENFAEWSAQHIDQIIASRNAKRVG